MSLLSRIVILISILAVLAACGQSDATKPEARVTLADAQTTYTFDGADTPWQTFSISGDQALFQVNNGALEGAVVADRGYIWSLEGSRHQNVAIQATVEQTQGSRGNGFGVMCRADENGNGYYFVISSAGQYAILKAVPDDDNPIWMVEWQFSSAISEDEPNTIEAVCAGDYLRFSANGQFLADLRDDTFDVGQVGVVLGAVEETLCVKFDDIVLRDAALVGS